MPQDVLLNAWAVDMKKKTLTIWLFQTGEPLLIDAGNPRPMRAMNLADALVAAGHNIVLWSSAFYHQEKSHRSRSAKRISVSPHYEIRLVPSPGYQRNIGLSRLWDHAVLAWNLKKMLASESQVPDVAFIGYPPIETAAVMTQWLAKRGVPSILDVKDQWPTIFMAALPAQLRIVGRIALAPYFYFGRRAMRDATALSAMAGGFLRWAADFAGRPIGELDTIAPLTTPSGRVSEVELTVAREWWQSRGVSIDGKPRICFVGSHTTAFDFTTVLEAAQALVAQNSPCEFIICGAGPSSAEWRQQAKGLPNVRFIDWVDRAQIEVLAEFSLAALAPYKNTGDFVMSIPNKVVDSLSLGLPVLSPLEGEVATLIDLHGAGLGYGARTGRSLAECIETLVHDPGLQRRLSKMARTLYSERFGFERVYGGLVAHIEELARRKPRETKISCDKLIERDRYDAHARAQLSDKSETKRSAALGSHQIRPCLRKPYLVYEQAIRDLVRPDDRVLELAAGSGVHTQILLQMGAHVTATDISADSLRLLEQRVYAKAGALTTQVADMEELPFPDGMFDVVVSAGGLSYGDNQLVLQQIKRLLKPGGRFICVDSLNHHPVYRINRYIHFLRGNRSYSTLRRMPTYKLIRQYQVTLGGESAVAYFGGASWLIRIFSRLGFESFWAEVSDRFDSIFRVRRSAFKFVLMSKKAL